MVTQRLSKDSEFSDFFLEFSIYDGKECIQDENVHEFRIVLK